MKGNDAATPTNLPSVLIVDDEPEVRNFFRHLLPRTRYRVTLADGESQAVKGLTPGMYDLALVDLKLADGDGLSILRTVRETDPACRVIVMTGYSTVRAAIDAIRLGAYDYLEKPFDDINALETIIAGACAGERRGTDWAEVSQQLDLIVGSSPAMVSLMLAAERLAQRNVTVLLTGETGTGKELLARFVHAASPRSDRPCFSVNCAALTESLLESELFGHERGAFTGAVSRKRGIFELANRGTLFLDEVADASPAIQSKVLRVLETGEFMRVGGEQMLKTDVRVIAATNRNLHEEVQNGRFREDLLYRLDVATLEVPPLRERREDITLFLDYFLKREQARQTQQDGVPALRLSDQAVKILLKYEWPGNVRELANAMATAAALSGGGLVLPEHLPRRILEHASPPEKGYRARPRPAVTATAPPASGTEDKAAGNEPGEPASEQAEDREADGRELPSSLDGLDGLLDHTAAETETTLRSGGQVDLQSMLERVDSFRLQLARQVIRCALGHTLGDRKAAAAELGITVRTLRYLLREKK